MSPLRSEHREAQSESQPQAEEVREASVERDPDCLYYFVGEGWKQEDDITLLTLRRSSSLS